MFRIKGLDHVVLRVADMDRSLAFYCGVLGCVEERRVERLGLVQLRAGASMIDLVPAREGGSSEARNMDHFAIRIDPYGEASLRAYLKEKGVRLGEAGQRYGAEGEGPSLYISDPDGNTVELKGPPS